MEALGEALGCVARAGDVVVLTGELGAGKTTLARGFGRALRLATSVSSPTFVVARTHQSTIPGGPALVHVDAYRIADQAEFEDLDIDLDGAVVLAEWAAGFIDVLTDSYLHIELERPTGAGTGAIEGDEPRTVTLEARGRHPDRYQRYLDQLGQG